MLDYRISSLRFACIAPSLNVGRPPGHALDRSGSSSRVEKAATGARHDEKDYLYSQDSKTATEKLRLSRSPDAAV